MPTITRRDAFRSPRAGQPMRNLDEMLAFIRSTLLNVGTVGPRTGPDRRTKDQKEWYCVARYLPTLAKQKLVQFPLELLKSESPDFVLTQDNGAEYGIEVTEAAERDYQEELAKTENLTRAHRISRDGWIGDAQERDCTKSILTAIQRKAVNINRETYRVACCDLLVYENCRAGGVALHQRDLFKMLTRAPIPHALCLDSNRISRISVLTGVFLFHDIFGAARLLHVENHS